MNILMASLAIGLYSAGFFCQIRKQPLSWVFALGLAAILVHAEILYRAVDVTGGQNLTIVNVISLVIWLCSVMLLSMSWRRHIPNLFLLVFPLAAFSIGLIFLLPGRHLINTGAAPKDLIHILLSIVAFSLLTIAALQALFLAWQERYLKQKKIGWLAEFLPPVVVMESVLFRFIAVGFLFLTVVLISSFYFFAPVFDSSLHNKTIMSLLAWLAYGIVLLGRWGRGWRGRTAILWTLLATILLVVAGLFF